MTARAIVAIASVPKLGPHVRLRFDKVRDCWTIQAPERVFVLDAIAHDIVARCDGEASVDVIVGDLCRVYGEAPHGAIEADVLKLIQDFFDKGVMTP